MHVQGRRRTGGRWRGETGGLHRCRPRGRKGLKALILVRGRPHAGAEASGKAIGWNTPPREDRSTRNGAEARTCHAMPRHSVVERSRISFSMKIFFVDCSSRGREFCKLMEKRKRWGASPAVHFMGQEH